MTTNRINHTTCSHPRTAAGRRACRAAVAKGTTLDMTSARSAEIDRQVAVFSTAFDTAKTRTRACRTMDRHCSQCGSIDFENVELGDQGYSACCNEPVMSYQFCRGDHR